MNIEQEINEKQIGMIIYVPQNTVKLDIEATIIDESDQLVKASTTYNMAELYDARIAGDEWESENIKYVLTDLGRTELDKTR